MQHAPVNRKRRAWWLYGSVAGFLGCWLTALAHFALVSMGALPPPTEVPWHTGKGYWQEDFSGENLVRAAYRVLQDRPDAQVRLVGYGWPCPLFAQYFIEEGSHSSAPVDRRLNIDVSTIAGFDPRTDDARRWLAPIMPVLHTTILFSLSTGLLFHALVSIRRRRLDSARGRYCDQCGYPLPAPPRTPRCPECGSESMNVSQAT